MSWFDALVGFIRNDMIIAKSAKDLDKMRTVGELIAEVREALRGMVEPGISTMELNNAAEKMIRDAGAIPTFIGYRGFPYAIASLESGSLLGGTKRSFTVFQSRPRSKRAILPRLIWPRPIRALSAILL